MPKSDTQFKAGNKGKLPGTVNNITRTVKETVLSTFNQLQKDRKHNLVAFAKKYPRDFYQIAAKLIPTEVKGNLNSKVLLEIVRSTKDTASTE